MPLIIDQFAMNLLHEKLKANTLTPDELATTGFDLRQLFLEDKIPAELQPIGLEILKLTTQRKSDYVTAQRREADPDYGLVPEYLTADEKVLFKEFVNIEPADLQAQLDELREATSTNGHDPDKLQSPDYKQNLLRLKVANMAQAKQALDAAPSPIDSYQPEKAPYYQNRAEDVQARFDALGNGGGEGE